MIFRSNEVKRILRFMVVGVSGTIVDFTILTLLKLLGLPTLLANTLSYLCGILNNFYWNRRWTFGVTSSQPWRMQFGQFFIVSLVGLILNNSMLLLLEAPFTHWVGQWGFLPAKVIATGVGLVWNYTANRFWTFRKQVE
jgi:putative flippase GtrA